MSKVTRLRHALPMSPDINTVVAALDKAIADAVGCRQGSWPTSSLIVGLFHGHAHAQTHQMMTARA